MLEECRICGSQVPFGATVHALIHTGTDAGVVDFYVCRSCYDEQLAPLFERSDDDAESRPDDGVDSSSNDAGG